MNRATLAHLVPPVRILPLLVIGMTLIAVTPASATEVTFTGIRVENRAIVASVRVPGLLGKKTRSRLESGEPFETTLRFYLYAGREYWPDEQLAIANVRLKARYDATTQEYSFSRTVGRDAPVEKKTRSLDELRELLESHDNLPIFPLETAWTGERVFVRVRVYLGTKYLLGVIPDETWSDKTSSTRFRLP